jgi:hypothetical protein
VSFFLKAWNRAKAGDPGSFVWSSGLVGTFFWGNDTFTARAPGGVLFYSATSRSNGVLLAANATSWELIFDRNQKENFKEVDLRQVLERVSAMPVSSW